MSFLPIVFQVILVATVVVAAIYDIRYRRIPNWLVLAALLLGIGLNVFLYSSAGLKTSLLGFGLAFAIYLPLYFLRGMGAGDVKLMGAIGAIAGPANWFGIFIGSSLIGGAVAVVLLLARGKLRNSLANISFLLFELAHFRPPYAREELDLSSPKSMKLPHGVMIACGVLTFLGASWMWAPR
jgi:prepilin peptidase CpaA